MSTFEQYKPRKIEFYDTIVEADFVTKVYTITNRESFESNQTLNAAVKLLPKWLENVKTSEVITHQHGFLMVHEAREGVLILFSWWTGENMVETNIYFSDFKTPERIVASIYNQKKLMCVWELEIFYHERKAWIKHILSQAERPDYKAYVKDYYIQQI